jgi:homoserine O-acetyltransferase
MSKLQEITLSQFALNSGVVIPNIAISYQVYGLALGMAPIILVNHALTGNSTITGENGWWNGLIGTNKPIDTNSYTVISINIPGNGFDGNSANLIYNYKDYCTKDIASIFWSVLFEIGAKELFAVIGGSLGGAIAWEMLALYPQKIDNLIPIATNWKATNWVISNVLIQDTILSNSSNPVFDARLHAMLLYRTPASLESKFKQIKNKNNFFEVENWLLNHGEKLKNRFQLASYKLMNHLLKTTKIANNIEELKEKLALSTTNIHIVGINTDLFFLPTENIDTATELQKVKSNVFYHEIKSIHGHDAFLIELEQLNTILYPLLINKNTKNYV